MNQVDPQRVYGGGLLKGVKMQNNTSLSIVILGSEATPESNRGQILDKQFDCPEQLTAEGPE